MKVKTFLCIGGPLNGHTVTEQYAGDEYTRFVSSTGVGFEWQRVATKTPGKTRRVRVIDRVANVLIFDELLRPNAQA